MADTMEEQTITCPDCHAGKMTIKYITYFTWLGNELVTVPEFPAWVCDLCGRRDYDNRAVSWLNTLLNSSTGKGKRRQYPRPPRAEQPPAASS